MAYSSLQQAVQDLDKKGKLIRIKEEVDPDLEMAAIHRMVFEAGDKAVFFEKVKGSNFPAVSNLFGNLENSKFLLRHNWDGVQQLVKLKSDPTLAMKKPLKYKKALKSAMKMRPKEVSASSLDFKEIQISDLPAIKSWPMDGGRFITLPQVYSENLRDEKPANGNLGMYRIQLDGNDYKLNEEIGMHYQIHRGIGVHHTIAKQEGQDLKVSIFVGGPPAHTLAAVMPLPEGLSELMFAGAMTGRRFRYAYADGYLISADADFVICGTIQNDLKPEGPFGDHLGYYSLQHEFPYLKVEKVLAKPKAIWPFTVVGRPPAEDSQFGALIHEITGDAIQDELPGVHAVHAVDEAGVHPLLLAMGSERYTPYQKNNPPMELLTQANHILGFGQLSLAKYLFILDKASAPEVDIHDAEAFIAAVLERIQLDRDLHFQTQTTIDTLDYSGESVNKGSKLVIAARGEPVRKLGKKIDLKLSMDHAVISRGILAIAIGEFIDYTFALEQIDALRIVLEGKDLSAFPLIVLCDDVNFLSEDYKNFLWQAFTRSNPSHDIYGMREKYKHKHWICEGNILMDVRKKPHHAPDLVVDAEVEKRAKEILAKA